MVNNISAYSMQLQVIVEEFVDNAQDILSLDLNQQILTSSENEQVILLAKAMFHRHYLTNERLLITIADTLARHSHSITKKMTAAQSDSLLVINDVIQDYIILLHNKQQQLLRREQQRKQAN